MYGTHTHIQSPRHTCICRHTHTHIQSPRRTRICRHTHTHAVLYVCTCICMHKHACAHHTVLHNDSLQASKVRFTSFTSSPNSTSSNLPLSVCRYVGTQVCMCVYACTDVPLYVCMYACMRVRTLCVCVCVCMVTYVRLYVAQFNVM